MNDKQLRLLALLFYFPVVYALVQLEVVGYGPSPLQARNNAIQQALRQNSRNIFADPLLEKFPLLQIVISEKAFGLIHNYRIVAHGDQDGKYWARVRVKLADALEQKWRSLRRRFVKRGKPTVLFCLREILEDNELDAAIAEYQLIQKFRDLGFEVVERQWHQKTKNLHHNIGNLPGAAATFAQTARACQARFVVVGTLTARFQGYEEYLSQQIIHDYHYDLQIIDSTSDRVIATSAQNYRLKHATSRYDKENAGKAGFTVIIQPRHIYPLVSTIVKAYLAEEPK